MRSTTMTLITVLAVAAGEVFKVTTINQSSGIYFEEIGKVELYTNEWKVVTFYDLKVLSDALSHATRYIKEISDLCTTLINESGFGLICNSTKTELNHLMADIGHKYKLLKGRIRSKRALFNVIGIASKTLFGTLNEEDAKFYDQQIGKLRYNEDHMLSLIKNQTFVLDTTVNVFNKSRNAIERQMMVLKDRFAKIKRAIDELSNATHSQQVILEMESLTTLTTLIIVRYQNVINTILDLIIDIRHGKSHPAVITTEQLESVLNTIRKEIPSDLRLSEIITDDNPLSLYRISSVSASIRKERIIYELRIPLPYKENYQLYKVIPLPTKFKNNFVFIQPSIKYLVVDYNKEHYYDLTTEEVGSCITENHERYLCRIAHPLYNTNGNQCELLLLKRQDVLPPSCNIRQSNHSTFWIQLSQINKWLYSTLKNITIEGICQDHIFPQILSGMGVIEIPGNCYIRTEELTIRGYGNKVTQLKNAYIPPLNVTNFLFNHTKSNYKQQGSRVAMIKYTGEDDLSEISKQISILKEEESKDLSTLDEHDIHHYSVSYGIIAVLLIIATFRLCKHFIQKGKQYNAESSSKKLERERKSEEPPVVFTCTTA